jgi:tetratricopeptide (TPR) repeat protein
MNRIEAIENMLAENPSDCFLQYALALEIAKAGDIELAIEKTERLLQNDPEYLGAYYQLGVWHEQLENFDKAITSYQSGIVLAKKVGNTKTANELEQALWLIED